MPFTPRSALIRPPVERNARRAYPDASVDLGPAFLKGLLPEPHKFGLFGAVQQWHKGRRIFQSLLCLLGHAASLGGPVLARCIAFGIKDIGDLATFD